MTLNCELIISSDVEHLRQIYAGFSLLHTKGWLKLKQTIPRELLRNKNNDNRWVNYKFYNAKVVINNKITIIYDVHDWNWIDEEILGEADFYFKRSYDEKYVSQLKDGTKVFPLGLIYPVTSRRYDVFQMQRAAFYSGKEKIKAIVKSLHLKKFGEPEQLDEMESYPMFDLPPKALFMTRVWDTDHIEIKSEKNIVEHLNETRANYIRVLRKEFGTRFFGGLIRSNYTVKHFNDCLLPDNGVSDKRKYLEILKKFPICIATTGLNNSNSWKLGEYVAFSKAIITEPLHFQPTGRFISGENYLEFSTPDQLTVVINCLFEDKSLRSKIMMNNYHYYQSFIKPDSLILNSLAIMQQFTSDV